MIRINITHCTGCKRCLKTCPYKAISIKKNIAVINYEKCTVCGLCVNSCSQQNAIQLIKNHEDSNKYNTYKDIAVFIEIEGKKHFKQVSLEILGEAYRLAQIANCKVLALLVSNNFTVNEEELIQFGADRVIHYRNSQLSQFKNEIFTSITLDFIENEKPSIFLAGATNKSRSFLPQVAAELKTGLTADCTKLEIEESLLLGTRPAFGGNLMATIICKTRRPQFATVRHNTMLPFKRDLSRKGEVIIKDKLFKEIFSLTEIIKIVKEKTDSPAISEAEIIVAGGYGLQSKKNFQLIKELAQLLKGTYGATRTAVDLGWAPYSHQVGQTGKTVNPILYLAFGISGAVQHIAGMQSSDYIIAINNDPSANIFNVSDVGICEDASLILSKLIAQLESC